MVQNYCSYVGIINIGYNHLNMAMVYKDCSIKTAEL